MMKIAYAAQSFERKNSEVCIVTEYPHLDKDLDFAIVKISSRYPETQQAKNTQCKEIVYVQEGIGRVTVNNVCYELSVGDIVLIEIGEKFFWEGNMTLYISCTPAFNVAQHVMVEA